MQMQGRSSNKNGPEATMQIHFSNLEDKSSVDPNRAPGTMDVSEIMEAFDDLAAPGISSSPHEPYNSPSVELLKVIQKDFGPTGVSPKDVHDLVDDFGDVDMSALDTAQAMLFERKTTCRPSAPAPIDIPERVRPKGHPGTFRCKGRRPLEDPRALLRKKCSRRVPHPAKRKHGFRIACTSQSPERWQDLEKIR